MCINGVIHNFVKYNNGETTSVKMWFMHVLTLLLLVVFTILITFLPSVVSITTKAPSCISSSSCGIKESCCITRQTKTCCNINTQACCGDGIGCVVPCESQFDATACHLDIDRLQPKRTSPSIGRFLYRILRPDEKLSGIVAKNPQASKTVLSHVNCGSRPNYKSQFISTCASLETALYYSQKAKEEGKGKLRIAIIDINQIRSTAQFVDLTTDANRDHYLGEAVCKNFAKKSEEVLLVSNQPIPFTLYNY